MDFLNRRKLEQARRIAVQFEQQLAEIQVVLDEMSGGEHAVGGIGSMDFGRGVAYSVGMIRSVLGDQL